MLLYNTDLIQFLGTFSADALVVELLFVYDVAINHFLAFKFWGFLIEEVNDLAAFLAVEVDMAVDVTIVAYTMFINCNHLSCMLLAQHSERVINCGTTQCWYIFT